MPTIERRRWLRLAAALPALVALPPRARAQDPASVAAPIRQLYDSLLVIMKKGRAASFMERFDLVAPAVDRALDIPAILQQAVGLRWTSLAEADRSDLLSQFHGFTVATYVANFDSFAGQRFEVSPGARPLANGDQLLHTQIVSADGEPHALDYAMHPVGAGWKAVDVLLDGSISRVAVLRSDFRGILASGGAPRLAADLREKAAALLGGVLPA